MAVTRKARQHNRLRALLGSLAVTVLAGCAALPPDGSVPSRETAPPAATPATVDTTPTPQVHVSTAEIRQLQELVAIQQRLYRTAAPLLVENAELCRKHARPLLGFRAKNRYSYPQELRNAADAVLGAGERLRITDVLPASGAAKAGVLPGDVLMKVGQQDFPAGELAERQAATVLAPLVTQRNALQLTVLREHREVTLDVPLTQACAFNIEAGHSDQVNAWGDGFRILVTRGMLQALHSDEELAYVIAKEMAHNILGHAARMNQHATAGGIIDNLVRLQPDLALMSGTGGLRPIPPEFDTAADRLSVYLLARAGYKLEQIVPFWRSMATRYPTSVRNAYTALHPSTTRRIDAMEQAVHDVRARRKDGRPLVPAP